MAFELGLSDAGLVVPRTADFLDVIRESYASDTNIAVDWDDDLVLGSLTAIMAQQLGQVSEALQAVYDAGDLNGAAGVQLSNLAMLVGVRRKAATKAQATVTLTGTVGTVLTVGRLMEGGGVDGRARWALTEDVTIP
ncbi:MAG TPA: baseplate J/gp47 family protein, partial [Ilumatobacter sp.]|nr:baseplate J/gp47 family protein [Ilumatobacter sp.]